MSVGRQVYSKLMLLGEGHRQCRDGRALQSCSWGQTSGGGVKKRWLCIECIYDVRCQILFVFPSVFLADMLWSHQWSWDFFPAYRSQVASTNLSSAFADIFCTLRTALGRRFILEWSIVIQNARSAVSNFGDILSLDCRWGLSITAIWLQHCSIKLQASKRWTLPWAQTRSL